MGPTLPDLDRRLSRRIESRRSIQLSPRSMATIARRRIGKPTGGREK